MTCLNLGTKGYVSFDWGDAAAKDNYKTSTKMRNISRQTQPQEVTPLPTTTKQRKNRDNDETPTKTDLKMRRRSRDSNNDDETLTAAMWQ